MTGKLIGKKLQARLEKSSKFQKRCTCASGSISTLLDTSGPSRKVRGLIRVNDVYRAGCTQDAWMVTLYRYPATVGERIFDPDKRNSKGFLIPAP